MRGRALTSACRSPGPEYAMAIKLELADDRPLVLDGLEQLFSAEQDIKVVARCLDGEAALAAVRKHRPDVVVLDLRMPVKDGLEVLRQIRLEKLPTRVVILTAALDEDDVVEAIRLGAPGVVLKEMAPHFLVQCIRKVHAGEQWLTERFSSHCSPACTLRMHCPALPGAMHPQGARRRTMAGEALRQPRPGTTAAAGGRFARDRQGRDRARAGDRAHGGLRPAQ